MDNQAPTGVSPQARAGGFSRAAWILANAVGLGVTYGLFALLGDVTEFGFGVGHDSFVRNLGLLVAVIVGSTVFVTLRRRVIEGLVEESTWVAVASGVGLAIGLTAGFTVGGPPFDFMLGVLMLGTIGGALQWRKLKHQVARPGVLLIVTIGGWLLAAIVAGGVAVLLGDALHTAFGSPPDGTPMGTVFFVFILSLMGMVGGVVGGSIEGAALDRRLQSR
jgi:hypothetical protein